MSFGERLQLLLDEQEISQKQLSADLGITYSTFNGYANNKRECDFETLKRIAIALNTSTDFLLGLTNHPTISHERQLTYNEAELISIYRQLTLDYQKLLFEQSKMMLKQNSKQK